MNKDIINRLSKENSKTSINTDVIQKVNFESNEKLLPSGEINNIVNVSKQFNTERQDSKKYRFISNIRPIMSNVLFNMTGTQVYGNAGWEIFGTVPFTDDPYDNSLSDEFGSPVLTFNESVTKHLREIDGWFGYFDPDIRAADSCSFYHMEPTRDRLSFQEPVNGNPNWFIRLSYPYSADTGHTMVTGGLMIVDKVDSKVANRGVTALGVPCNHNLSVNDDIRLTGIGGGLDGDYRVIRVGLDNGDNKTNYFVIDVDPSLIASASGRVKKVVNGQESSYYFRLFKSTTLDFESFEMGFEKTIFNDPTTQLMFNDDYDISDLSDNLGRPLSEVYVSFLKMTDSNFFTSVQSGIECPLINGIATDGSIPDIHRITTSSTHQPLQTIGPYDDLTYGDLVEYNPYRVKEELLNDVYHRFNTVDREYGGGGQNTGGPRQEGYFYKPNYLNKLRVYSSYIEQGDDSVVGIPSYAENLGDGRYLWRDILDIGLTNELNESVDYPFQNGAHYIYNNISFSLRRQDPFGVYGLLFSGTRPDFGGKGYNDVYSIKTTDDIC